MNRLLLLLLLLLAIPSRAAAYPSPTGRVNDFAGKIAADDRDVIEQRLTEFERKTSIEIAVVTVPSLEGEPVEAYAKGLFNTWGIGKRGVNNGVLFLWAPTERKVRIQTGDGSQLTNSRAADIVDGVTALFRRNKFRDGVNYAVDEITLALSKSSAPQTFSASPAPSESAPPAKSHGGPLATLFFGGILIALSVEFLIFRRAREARMRKAIPETLATAPASIDQLESDRDQAVRHMESIRRELPPEVANDLDVRFDRLRSDIDELRSELVDLYGAPLTASHDLRKAYRTVKTWKSNHASAQSTASAISKLLSEFDECRNRAAQMLAELGPELGRAQGEGVRGGRLLTAARATYETARSLAQTPPVNWLLVYDLLVDVEESLFRLPHMQSTTVLSRRRPSRRWRDSHRDSEAAAVMMAYWPQWGGTNAATGSFTGVDTGAGFGGGFSSGGGASGSY